ncbi:MAG: tetratricopeptide repeat protein, partial [Flavobacteriaceae bacterium]
MNLQHSPTSRLYTTMFLYVLVSLFPILCSGQDQLLLDSLLSTLNTHSHDSSKVNTLNELAWELRIANPEKATSYANEAKEISQSLEYPSGFLTSLNRLGVIAFYKKDFPKAESLYLEILEGEKKQNNRFGIGRAHNQLGEIYKNMGDHQKAIEHASNSLEIFTAIDRWDLVAVVTT